MENNEYKPGESREEDTLQDTPNAADSAGGPVADPQKDVSALERETARAVSELPEIPSDDSTADPAAPADTQDRVKEAGPAEEAQDENRQDAGSHQDTQADAAEPGRETAGQVPPRPKNGSGPKMPRPPRDGGPAGQIRRASSNPAAALILAVVGLVFAVIGSVGSWWLVAGVISVLLSAVALFFAWHAWRPRRLEMLALSLAAAVLAIAVFALGHGITGTIQRMSWNTGIRYEYGEPWDPYDEAEDYYRDFFEHDDDWYGIDEYNGYWD